jgi:hypothetical protein
VLAPLFDHPPDRVDHRNDRRLVVGAEDGARGVSHDALRDHRVDRPLRRDRVQVGAEEERGAAAVRRCEAAVEVPDLRPDRRAGVVLVDGEPEATELAEDAVGDGALLTRRRRDRSELEEQAHSLGRPLVCWYVQIRRHGL